MIARTSTSLAAAALALLCAAPAAAQIELESFFTGADTPAVDGDLGEWFNQHDEELVPFVPLDDGDRVGGEGEWEGLEDASGEIAVAHSDKALFVAFKAVDQRFVRTKKLFTGEDHLQIWLAAPRKKGSRLDLIGVGVFADPSRWPGRVKLRKLKPGKPRAKGKIKGAKGAVRGPEQGYQVEVAIPWRSLKIDRRRRAALRAAIYLVDGDMAAKPVAKSILGTAPLAALESPDRLPRLAQSDLTAGIETFCSAKDLPLTEPTQLVIANVAGGKEPEEVLVIDRYVMVQGGAVGPPGTYVYHQLPVKFGEGVLSLETRDLTGDRRAEIIVAMATEGAAGVRKWVEIYRLDQELIFQRVFAAATLVESGGARIENSYRFVRGKGKRKDIEVRPGKVTGVDAASLGEVPEEAGNPMVLPWSKPKKRRYRYRDGRYTSE